MSSKLLTKDKSKLTPFCPRFHAAVELIGRRWSGAIIRALLSGPRRFKDLVAVVPSMSDRLLAERLRELELAGIVQREISSGPPVRVAYALTEAGQELDRPIAQLAAWAERWIRPQARARR
jgi:DNA-binding HxlR family transcriptional regulator